MASGAILFGTPLAGQASTPLAGEWFRLRGHDELPPWPVFLKDSTASVEDACYMQPLC
jgi:hypothetical protein